MSRPAVAVLSVLGGLVLGMLIAWAFVAAERADAQPAAGAPWGVAIAPGPGGMWVVNGDQLRVCTSGPLRAGFELFTPACGEPVPLR